MEERTLKIRWDGPAQQVCYALGAHGYKAVIVPGKTYEVPAELARRLFASSRHWSQVSNSGPARPKQTFRRPALAGSTTHTFE